MRLLVCEGECGEPFTKLYDAQVREDAGKSKDLVIERARALVHTPHRETGRRGLGGRDIFACLQCGTERVFGWPDDGAHPSS